MPELPLKNARNTDRILQSFPKNFERHQVIHPVKRFPVEKKVRESYLQGTDQYQEKECGKEFLL